MSNWPSQINFDIIATALAICGGIARTLQEYVEGTQLTLGKFIARTFISGFAGWLFYKTFGAIVSNEQQDLLAVAAGIGGVMGWDSVKFIETLLKGRLTVIFKNGHKPTDEGTK